MGARALTSRIISTRTICPALSSTSALALLWAMNTTAPTRSFRSRAVHGTGLERYLQCSTFGVAGAANVGSSGTYNRFEGDLGNDRIIGNGNTRRLRSFPRRPPLQPYSVRAVPAPQRIFSGGDGSIGNDELVSGVNSAVGTNFADSYNATAFNLGFNQFEGRGGNDTIVGNGDTQNSVLWRYRGA